VSHRGADGRAANSIKRTITISAAPLTIVSVPVRVDHRASMPSLRTSSRAHNPSYASWAPLALLLSFAAVARQIGIWGARWSPRWSRVPPSRRLPPLPLSAPFVHLFLRAVFLRPFPVSLFLPPCLAPTDSPGRPAAPSHCIATGISHPVGRAYIPSLAGSSTI